MKYRLPEVTHLGDREIILSDIEPPFPPGGNPPSPPYHWETAKHLPQWPEARRDTFATIAAESKLRFSLTVDFILMDIFRRHELDTRDIKRHLNHQYGKFAAQNNYDGYAMLRGPAPSLFNSLFGFDL